MPKTQAIHSLAEQPRRSEQPRFARSIKEGTMPNVVATSALAVAIPLAALLGGGALMARVAPRQEIVQKPLMKRWGYNGKAATSYWAALDSAGLAAERRFLEVDLIFPFVYGAGLLTGLLLVWASLGRPFAPTILLVPVAVSMIADWTENLIHLRQLGKFVDQGAAAVHDGWIAVSSVATIAKLSLLGVSAVGLLVLVGALLLRGGR